MRLETDIRLVGRTSLVGFGNIARSRGASAASG